MGLRKNLTFVVSCGVGIFIGAATTLAITNTLVQPPTVCDSHFKLINPQPDCDQLETQAKKLNDLQEKITAIVKAEELQPGIERIGVFLRDLKSYRFAGINDEQQFYLTSLGKVPLLIAYYKFAEIEPAILTDTYTYTGTPNEYEIQDIPVDDKLVVGNIYSINDLLMRSIRYSDNTAAQILLERLDPKLLDNVMADLGIRISRPEGEKEDIITPRTYANVYRILYNSSYLNREYSNKALELLTTTTFERGVVAGIPEGITVAHKFGERTMIDAKTNAVIGRQLLDCGIIYANTGEKPYSFCLMAQGMDYSVMENSFEKISKIIYENLAD